MLRGRHRKTPQLVVLATGGVMVAMLCALALLLTAIVRPDYFHWSIFPKTTDSFWSSVFTDCLEQNGEHRLQEGGPDVLRFCAVDRPGAPLLIRIERDPSGRPLAISHSNRIELSESIYRELLRGAAESGLWSDAAVPGEFMDGNEWVVEGVRDHHYGVYFGSPFKETPQGRLIEAAARVSGNE